MENYSISPAVEGDAVFLGEAICQAERAHTGKGIWDVVCPTGTKEILARAAIFDPNSHFHFSRFLVARLNSTGLPAAAACAFKYPDCSIDKSKAGIIDAALDLGYYSTKAEAEAPWEELSFLDQAFPSEVEYDNTWMVECVYTSEEHRGHGLAMALLRDLIQRGAAAGLNRCLISCAVGNDAALKLYQRAGLRVVGQGHSERCMDAIGSSGFYILEKSLQDSLSGVDGPSVALI